MKLRVVSSEAVRLLKEIKYNLPTFELALVQMWLMKRHNLHIRIMPEFYRDGINYNWQVLEYDTSKELYIGKETGWYGDNGEYPSYDKALGAGILKSIKLIQS